MGTNYYRIPCEKKVKEKHEKLLKEIEGMELTPSLIDRGFNIVPNPNSQYEWDWFNPWQSFMDGLSIHLGKRSCGWKFCWNFNDKKYYSNKEELLAFIREGRVVDEYGEEQDVEEFIKMALEWGQPDGWVYGEAYLIDQYDKKGVSRPPFAYRDYFDKEIDGLRVSTSTEFS